MGYDPDKHHRRSIRLRGWDYAQQGAYFVTIVTHEGECWFDDSALRHVVEAAWAAIPGHFPHVELDEWVVMPNHIHGIIVIATHPSGNVVGATQCVAPTNGHGPPLGPAPGSLGAIIGAFKSYTARKINRLRDTPGAPVWQRNYYEHIVRNEQDLDAIRRYIRDNPAHWAEDLENPSHYSAFRENPHG